jgi:hypothetical protein
VALADAKKGVSMFLSEAINVPVWNNENMAYFTPESYLMTISITCLARRSKKAEDLRSHS